MTSQQLRAVWHRDSLVKRIRYARERQERATHPEQVEHWAGRERRLRDALGAHRLIARLVFDLELAGEREEQSCSRQPG